MGKAGKGGSGKSAGSSDGRVLVNNKSKTPSIMGGAKIFGSASKRKKKFSECKYLGCDPWTLDPLGRACAQAPNVEGLGARVQAVHYQRK